MVIRTQKKKLRNQYDIETNSPHWYDIVSVEKKEREAKTMRTNYINEV